MGFFSKLFFHSYSVSFDDSDLQSIERQCKLLISHLQWNFETSETHENIGGFVKENISQGKEMFL